MKFALSTLIISLLTLLSKAAGFVRDIFLALFFGASNLADLFFLALKFPIILGHIFTEESFNASFLPASAAIKSVRHKYQFARKILLLIIIIFLPAILLCEIFMPEILSILAAGKKDDPSFDQLVLTSRIIFPSIFFVAISCVFIGLLYEKNKFTLANLVPILTSLLIILAVLTHSYIPIVSNIDYVSISVLFASIVQCVLLIFSAPKKLWQEFFVCKRLYTSISAFFNLYWPLCFSAFVLQLTSVYYLYLNSYQESAISWIYFAERIYFLPITLIAIPLATVMIPNISRLILNDKKASYQLQNQALKYLILCMIPITILMFFSSEHLVRFLFERGEFKPEDTFATSEALKIFLIGMPAFCLSIILRPYFAASYKGRTIFYTSFISSLAGVIVAMNLIESMQYLAVPVGVSFSSWFNVSLLVVLQIRNNFLRYDRNLNQYLYKYLFYSFLLGIFLTIFDFFSVNLKNTFIILLSYLIIYTTTIILFIRVFDSELYNKLKDKIKKRINREV